VFRVWETNRHLNFPIACLPFYRQRLEYIFHSLRLFLTPWLVNKLFAHLHVFSAPLLIAADVWDMSRLYVMLSLLMVRDAPSALLLLQLCNKLWFLMMRVRSGCSATFAALQQGFFIHDDSSLLGLYHLTRHSFHVLSPSYPCCYLHQTYDNTQRKNTIQQHAFVLFHV